MENTLIGLANKKSIFSRWMNMTHVIRLRLMALIYVRFSYRSLDVLLSEFARGDQQGEKSPQGKEQE